MSIFCGKKCTCKKRCDDFFTERVDEHTTYQSPFAAMCRHACKTNKNLTPEAFLQTLSPEQLAAYHNEIPAYCYGLYGELLTQEEWQMMLVADPSLEGQMKACMPHAPSQAKRDLMKIVLVASLLIVAAYIFWKNK